MNTSRSRQFLVGSNLVIGLGGTLVAMLVQPAPPTLGPSSSSAVGAIGIALFAWALVSSLVLAIASGASRRQRLVSALSVILLMPAFGWCRRYTAVGILVMGGGNYWVERASQAVNDDEATLYLRRILGASQYGVDVAERVVLSVSDDRQRARLFTLLGRAVPWPTWQQRYEQHAREAAVRSGP